MPLISYILFVFFCFFPQFIEYFSGLFWQNCHFWATVIGIYHICRKLSKMAAALFLTDKCLWVVLLNSVFVALSLDAYNALSSLCECSWEVGLCQVNGTRPISTPRWACWWETTPPSPSSTSMWAKTQKKLIMGRPADTYRPVSIKTREQLAQWSRHCASI